MQFFLLLEVGLLLLLAESVAVVLQHFFENHFYLFAIFRSRTQSVAQQLLLGVEPLFLVQLRQQSATVSTKLVPDEVGVVGTVVVNHGQELGVHVLQLLLHAGDLPLFLEVCHQVVATLEDASQEVDLVGAAAFIHQTAGGGLKEEVLELLPLLLVGCQFRGLAPCEFALQDGNGLFDTSFESFLEEGQVFQLAALGVRLVHKCWCRVGAVFLHLWHKALFLLNFVHNF